MELQQEIEIINLFKKGLHLNLNFSFITDHEEIKEKIHSVRSPIKLGQFTLKNLEIIKYVNIIDPPKCYVDDQMFDLIKFVEKGNKVVPPMLIHYTNYVDWIKEPEKPLQLCDGSHRSSLAFALGYREIPFIINPKENHVFSISTNDFSVDEKEFTVTNPEEKKMSFMLDSYYVYVDRSKQQIIVEEKWL